MSNVFVDFLWEGDVVVADGFNMVMMRFNDTPIWVRVYPATATTVNTTVRYGITRQRSMMPMMLAPQLNSGINRPPGQNWSQSDTPAWPRHSVATDNGPCHLANGDRMEVVINEDDHAQQTGANLAPRRVLMR